MKNSTPQKIGFYKNIHIFNRETIYSNEYIEFINRNFKDSCNHLFVFRIKDTDRKGKYSEEIKSQIWFVNNPFSLLIKLLPLLLRSERIFMHFLPIGRSLIFWYLVKQYLLRKVIWVQWGHDLYFYYKDKNVKEKFFEWLRRKIIKRIAYIATIIWEDYQLTRKLYTTQALYYYTFYPNPVDYNSLTFSYESKDSNERILNVMIGNSANKTNRHKEVLYSLNRYHNGSCYLFCPLSYGASYSEIKRIISYGKDLFDGRFYYFTKRLSPSHYGTFLSQMDVAIMNHLRQAGLGTILSLLYLGKKVFVRDDITSFGFLKRLELKISSTNKLLSGQVDNLDLLSYEDAINNHRVILNEFSEKRCKELWQKLFNI